MTTLHVREVNGAALLPLQELELLLKLARRSEAVAVELQLEDDLPATREAADLASRSAAWKWLEDEPELYARADAQPL